MRIVVCVKWVPALGSLRFDPETRRLVREGLPGEVSSFDLRALGAAVALRAAHGGEVVALTMGPPGARDGLVECLALGADRALHLVDAVLAGSDPLATARALAAALEREAPDLVLFGRASTDAETGQVGPEVAELLGLAQVTGARRLELDPAARTFVAERETDEGFETVSGPLPAVVTAAEDLAEERFPTKAERQAAEAKPIASLGAAEVGLLAEEVGARGSPTWVAGIEHVPSVRRGEILAGDSPAPLARALGERLRQPAPASDDRPPRPRPLPRARPVDGARARPRAARGGAARPRADRRRDRPGPRRRGPRAPDETRLRRRDRGAHPLPHAAGDGDRAAGDPASGAAGCDPPGGGGAPRRARRAGARARRLRALARRRNGRDARSGRHRARRRARRRRAGGAAGDHGPRGAPRRGGRGHARRDRRGLAPEAAPGRADRPRHRAEALRRHRAQRRARARGRAPPRGRDRRHQQEPEGADLQGRRPGDRLRLRTAPPAARGGAARLVACGGGDVPAPGCAARDVTYLWGAGVGRRGGGARPRGWSCGGRARSPPRRTARVGRRR